VSRGAGAKAGGAGERNGYFFVLDRAPGSCIVGTPFIDTV